jgi:prevent-host-death family protein
MFQGLDIVMTASGYSVQDVHSTRTKRTEVKVVEEIPVTQARAELAELVNRVAYTGERVTLTRHGRPVAGLVSAADLARLAELDQPVTGQVGYVAPPAAAPPTLPPPPHRFDVAARHETGGDPGGTTPRA